MQETLCEAVSAVGLRYLYEILDREPRQYTMTVCQAIIRIFITLFSEVVKCKINVV